MNLARYAPLKTAATAPTEPETKGRTAMAAQADKTLNIIRGKNLVGKATKEEVLKLFEHLDALEELLDEADGDDYFGTEGWRHRLGVD